MTYTADQARQDHNTGAKEQELAGNLGRIRAITLAGGRSASACFVYSGFEPMAAQLRALGYDVESTHQGRGMLVRW